MRLRIKIPGAQTLWLAAIVASAAFLALPSARAQEPTKPGKEHELLNKLVGTWEVESEYGSGTMTYKMDLDGHWLVSEFDGEFGGVKILGKGLETYDASAKKYRSIWVDSLSAKPRILEGNFDKESKVMTLTGEGPWQEDSKAQYKSLTELKDINTLNFGLFILEKDGKEQALVTIKYKRKK